MFIHFLLAYVSICVFNYCCYYCLSRSPFYFYFTVHKCPSSLLVNIFSFYAAVLVFVFRHPPVVIGLLALTEHVRKLHVVGNDDELEVFLFSARVHDIN